MSTISEQILDCFPSGSYAISALLRLMEIEESSAVETAAVECRVQPRMLINPEFVQAHAETPEKLMMLVMHELHHILLGHTTLFKRITALDNFVFDAVINGLLCRMFPQPEFTAFFRDYYSEEFPYCLLRPPAHWPGKYTPPAGLCVLNQPLAWQTAAINVHQALYSPTGATYQEVIDVLPRLLVDFGLDGIPLLGDHSGEGGSPAVFAEGSSVLTDVVRKIVEEWPKTPDPIRGRALGELLDEELIRHQPQPSARVVLRRLIRKLAVEGSGRGARIVTAQDEVVQQPIPQLDRRALVQRALGYAPLLYRAQLPMRRVLPAGERVHVYLDVSGSIAGIKGMLYGAVLDCRADVHPTIHLFSAAIADVSLAELSRGVCRSTGGTDVRCIAEHIQRHRVKRALIITDGYVGTPSRTLCETLARTVIAVAYTPSFSTYDLAPFTNFSATLPIGVSA